MVVPEKIGKIRLLSVTDSRKWGAYVESGLWKEAPELKYTKYNIKESDMRIKTATFTSPDYIDLTTGRYLILISSIYHENFSGFVLDVDYDEETGLYTYQCQDWSRSFISKFQSVITGQVPIYDLLIMYITQMNLWITKGSFSSKLKNKEREVLSGLKPLWRYDQSLYEGNLYKGNFFKQKPKMIIRDKSFIEAIRDLVFGSLGFYDVWFNDRGILQITPLSKTDWENTGLHLTTGSALKSTYKFSTTNAITRVVVNGQGTDAAKGYNLNDIPGHGELNLALFFGNVSTSISDPVQKTETKTTTTNNSSNKNTTNKNNNVNTDNPYQTKRKEVWITIDNIFGKSQDRKIMTDFASEVQKSGWKAHVVGVGPSYHYAHAPGYSLSGKVNNAVWLVLYGGACAGTLYESATARWYRQPLVKRGSRTVVGFIHPPCGDIRKGGKYYHYLPRAHDDNFSPASFRGLNNPGKFLVDRAIPWMYAKNGKDLAKKFLAGGDFPEACTNTRWKRV